MRASPTYSQDFRRVVCGTSSGELLLFDPVARKLCWRLNTSGRIVGAAAVDSGRGSVLVGSLDGSINSVNLADGT